MPTHGTMMKQRSRYSSPFTSVCKHIDLCVDLLIFIHVTVFIERYVCMSICLSTIVIVLMIYDMYRARYIFGCSCKMCPRDLSNLVHALFMYLFPYFCSVSFQAAGLQIAFLKSSFNFNSKELVMPLINLFFTNQIISFRFTTY